MLQHYILVVQCFKHDIRGTNNSFAQDCGTVVRFAENIHLLAEIDAYGGERKAREVINC